MVRSRHAKQGGLDRTLQQSDEEADVLVPDLVCEDHLQLKPVAKEHQRFIQLDDGDARVMGPDNSRHGMSPQLLSSHHRDLQGRVNKKPNLDGAILPILVIRCLHFHLFSRELGRQRL